MKNRKKRKFRKILYVYLFFIFSLAVITSLKFYIEKIQKTPVISPVSFLASNSQKKIEDLLKKYNIQYDFVASSQSAYLIKLKAGEEAILKADKPLELEQQISSLQLVLSRLKIEGKRFIRLDFRYDKPIVHLIE